MKHLEISGDFLRKILKNKKPIAQTNSSIIFDLGEDTLFKFRSVDFLDCFARDDNGNIDYTLLGDVSDKINQLKERETIINRGKGSIDICYLQEIDNMRQKIKYSKFPIGFMLVDGLRVGYILPKHKGMITLYDALQHQPLDANAQNTIIGNIYIAMTELYTKCIFMRNMNCHNILVNPTTYETQFINLEDNVELKKCNNEALSRHMIRQMNTIKGYILDATPVQNMSDNELEL